LRYFAMSDEEVEAIDMEEFERCLAKVATGYPNSGNGAPRYAAWPDGHWHARQITSAPSTD
jgi:hypothetical protein